MKTAISTFLAITALGTAVICFRKEPSTGPDEGMADRRLALTDDIPSETLVRQKERSIVTVTHSLSSGDDSITTQRHGHDEELSTATSETSHGLNRKNVARRSTRAIPSYSDSPSTSPYPAIWIDLPGAFHFTSEQQASLQKDAEALLEELNSADQTGLPESTKAELINASDLDFRRKYGVRAWLSHHAQARALFDGRNGK